MNFIKTLPLGIRLAFASVVCLSLMLLMAGASLWSASHSQRALIQITTDTTPKQLDALRLRALILDSQSLTYQYLASKNGSFSSDKLAAIEASQAKANEALKQMAARVNTSNAGAESFSSEISAYSKIVLDVIDLAKDDISFATTEMIKAESAYIKLSEAISRLNQQRQDESDVAIASAESLARTSRTTIIAISVVSLLMVVVISWAVRATILQQIERIAESSRRLRAGDLSPIGEVEGNDEIAETSRALIDTVAALRGTMGAIRKSTSAIDTSIGELTAGNRDFSDRTERAAATLQRTAADMSRLSERVSESARNAGDAAKIAIESRSAAERGGGAVDDVVKIMGDITASAHKIRDITTVIDGIAFQTNILALNAAVEAARAGEHGRGFAVVASEVRALSQRSAKAAAEIKCLIVASVERVESGAVRVGQAGEAMIRIVSSARELSTMVDTIAATSIDQSNNVESVARSITELELATQQNAALVEQAAAASDSVRSESSRLVSAVGTFRLA